MITNVLPLFFWFTVYVGLSQRSFAGGRAWTQKQLDSILELHIHM